MAKVSARTATWAKWAAVPAALLVSGVAVSQASYSAFSATTESSASNWKAGTVALDNSAKGEAASGVATFTAGNMKPGDTGVKCITVTSSGSLASTVKLYSKAFTNDAKNLASSIDLVITEGTAGDSACAGFQPAGDIFKGTLTQLGGLTAWNTGVGTWAPTAGSTTRTYRIAYGLNGGAPSSTMGGTASIGFVWEAQNS